EAAPLAFQSLGPLLSPGTPDPAQPLAADVTVVAVAEGLLHLLPPRVDLLAEGGGEAVGQPLHRVAELLAEDADLVEVVVVVEVLAGGPVQLPHQFPQQHAAEVAQRPRPAILLRVAHRPEGLVDQLPQLPP